MTYLHYNQLLSNYDNYDYEFFLSFIHFLFHELRNTNPFTTNNLIIAINKLIPSLAISSILSVNYELRLEMIIFIIIYLENNYGIKKNPYLKLYLKKHIKLALYSLNLKEQLSEDLISILNFSIETTKQDIDDLKNLNNRLPWFTQI